jgi:hypothetical protein
MGADVARKELAGGAKGELGCDPLQPTDALAVVEDLTHALQSSAVQEHHAVHELDAALPARGKNLANVSGGDAGRFFHEHMLSGFRRADGPRLADSRWQREIDGIHGIAGHEFFIAAHGARSRIKGDVSLAFADEPPAAVEFTAGHGRQSAIRCIMDGLPVFSGDVRRSQNSPAADCSRHSRRLLTPFAIASNPGSMQSS